eukprot:TRINITY_DN23969_c0_g1_i1.p1 TRINITY_DN23969_c0_g1~~TRINITY_DN23969_c0_g1_i1.p1  ORF type:complete len:740 (-),score=124.79 TRINITY_DN23969_c0_g1_i1:193-2322(-)
MQAIFDFDKTLAKEMIYDLLGGPNIELAKQMQTSWWIEQFGGQERLDMLDRMLENLTELGVKSYICSFNHPEVIAEGLQRVNLIHYFSSHTSPCGSPIARTLDPSNHDKGQRVKRHLQRNGDRASDALFADDTLSHVERVRRANFGVMAIHVDSGVGLTSQDCQRIVEHFQDLASRKGVRSRPGTGGATSERSPRGIGIGSVASAPGHSDSDTASPPAGPTVRRSPRCGTGGGGDAAFVDAGDSTGIAGKRVPRQGTSGGGSSSTPSLAAAALTPPDGTSSTGAASRRRSPRMARLPVSVVPPAAGADGEIAQKRSPHRSPACSPAATEADMGKRTPRGPPSRPEGTASGRRTPSAAGSPLAEPETPSRPPLASRGSPAVSPVQHTGGGGSGGFGNNSGVVGGALNFDAEVPALPPRFVSASCGSPGGSHAGTPIQQISGSGGYGSGGARVAANSGSGHSSAMIGGGLNFDADVPAMPSRLGLASKSCGAPLASFGTPVSQHGGACDAETPVRRGRRTSCSASSSSSSSSATATAARSSPLIGSVPSIPRVVVSQHVGTNGGNHAIRATLPRSGYAAGSTRSGSAAGPAGPPRVGTAATCRAASATAINASRGAGNVATGSHGSSTPVFAVAVNSGVGGYPNPGSPNPGNGGDSSSNSLGVPGAGSPSSRATSVVVGRSPAGCSADATRTTTSSARSASPRLAWHSIAA